MRQYTVMAKEIAKARIDADLTRTELARRCGWHLNAISRLERRGTGSLRLKQKVAQVLGRPFDELFPDEARKLREVLGGSADGSSPVHHGQAAR